MLVSQVVSCSGVSGRSSFSPSSFPRLPASVSQPSSESGASILAARNPEILRKTATRLISAPRGWLVWDLARCWSWDRKVEPTPPGP